MKRLGILAAMPEEFREIRSLISDPQIVETAGRSFVCGSLEGFPVVAVLARIGKVAAALTTTILIERFAVDGIVGVGVAGGIHPRVNIGDFVVGTHYLHHDMDASPTGRFARHEIPLLNKVTIEACPEFVRIMAEAIASAGRDEGVVAAYQRLSLPAPTVHQGLVISGDQFISCVDKVALLRAHLPEAYCVEMEGAAIAQVCFEYGVPFVVVRSISDRADHAAPVDFFTFIEDCAAHASASIVRGFLRGRG